MRNNICFGLIILVTLMGGIYPVYGQAEGLIAHWKLDETSGDQVSDSVGGHNGWLLGYPDDSQWMEGIIDGARMFDGVDDFGWMEEYTGISDGNSRTVAAWIKTGDSGNIISWGRQELTKSWCLMVNFSTIGTRGALFLVVMGGIIVGETDLRDNNWHHVAAVLENDGTPDVSEVKLYVDGKLEGFSFVAAGAIDTSDDINVQLGAWTIGIGANKYFNGLMDDVRIYNKALSLEEIQALQIKYGGGTGEPNDPYQIHTAAHMQAVGTDPNDWDKHFILMADIDLGAYTGTQFNVIGNDSTPFLGVFDGNNHVISGFSYTSDSWRSYTGLFGYISTDGYSTDIIRNLSLIAPQVSVDGWYIGSLAGYLRYGNISNCMVENVVIEGSDSVGGIVGYSLAGEILHCSITGSVQGNGSSIGGVAGDSENGGIKYCHANAVVTGYRKIGGLVGQCDESSIFFCSADGDVSGNHQVGGLVGENTYGRISSSYAAADVTGADYKIGGLVGESYRSWSFDCYARGSVTGNSKVGGLVGYVYKTAIGNPSVGNCYATGKVTGTGGGQIGGLIGYRSDASISNSFWDKQTSEQENSDGGTKLETAEMQMKSTYTDAGWDFTTPVWEMACECGNYPRLQWEVLKYDVGSGTMEDPYLICTAEQMNAIGANPNDWDKCFKLMADIDLAPYTSTQFNIIGTETAPFTGTFDGDGKTISNLSYISTETDYIGLFRCIHAPGGGIRNLGLIDPNIIAGEGEYVGSLVGKLSTGWISGCYVLDGRVSGHWSVGGLVGTNDSSSGWLSRCYASSNVSGDACIGGLIGYSRGLINECFSSKSVSSNADVIGGLIGTNHANGEITNSFSSANVFGGRNHAGGIAGMNAGTIFNCYSSGNVMGNSWVGGLVGSDSNGSYTKCFWDNTINPLLTGIGDTTDPNVIGESTVNMHMESTFTDYGWDFVNETDNGIEDIWRLCVDGVDYPLLWWQFNKADFVCPDGVDFIDFSLFGLAWQSEDGQPKWNQRCDISDPNDNIIDELDLDVFCYNWLAGL